MRILLVMFAAACGAAQAGGPGGPTVSGRMTERTVEEPLQSNDVLERDAVTRQATVKHILISWGDLKDTGYRGRKMDPRAAQRSRREADELAVQVLERARKGEDFDALMKATSEDTGPGTYDVNAQAEFVFEFKRMALRLNVGEVGLVKTQFGWHIMKRIE